jgi:chloramphenicol O-acetyltransferase type A
MGQDTRLNPGPVSEIGVCNGKKMNYKIIDKETYYRKGVFRHFSEDCKCSTSMTARIDVMDLVEYSKKKETKFYINFLYILSKVLNSREDYRMGYYC